MRGTAMGSTAAASGFVVFLLSVSVVQGQDDWGVTYTSTHICAFKGSTVDIHCTYGYPYQIKGTYTTVDEAIWFAKLRNYEPVDLRTDSEYAGRVQYNFYYKGCSLRITNLRERDSAEYKFMFTTNQEGKYTGEPGVTLTVTGLQVHVDTHWFYCETKCQLPGHHSYIWYRNGKPTQVYTDYFYPDQNNPDDYYSCALSGYESFRSPSVYAPKLPSVSVSPSGEIIEGSSVTLTCSSDANPAAKYTWYKKNVNPDLRPPSKEPHFVFNSIQSSDSGEYYCTAENQLGKRTSEYIFIDVKYGPKLPSVSASPSAEIVEGSSVTLTCSSNANPAAKYTWYKGNQTLQQGPEEMYYFTSISYKDRGFYHCKSMNNYGQINSSSHFIDVHYAPKLPSVSVSPSGEIVEGSSVTLNCSSDANPAAKYTWYKENEDSPKASGQIFTITDVRPGHSGNYYCEAQNRRGSHNSTLHLTVVKGTGITFIAAGGTAAVLLLIIILSVFLWMRKKRVSNQPSEAEERPDETRERTQPEQDNIMYASVQFSNNQADSLYSNTRPAQLHRHMEEQEVTEYAAVNFNRASNAPRTRGRKTGEDSDALYSTVNKT